jgi:transposase
MLSLAQILNLPDIRIEHGTIQDEQILLWASSLASRASCPSCACPSSRIHSTYARRLAALPCNGLALTLILSLHRFRCLNPACPRTTFVEPLPSIAPPFARRTNQLKDMQRLLGLALGGEAGARLAAQLNMPTSADTLLRLVRSTPVPKPSPPTAIGVDDWAKRKGHCYGTIICDLETHRPIDLLPDRTSQTFQSWLKHQPQVQVISRDRAGAYAEAASRGAPQAMQVADRFHLLGNLRAPVQEILQRSAKLLHAPSSQGEAAQQQPGAAGQDLTGPTSNAPSRRMQEQQQLERRQQRHALYDQMLQYGNEGWSQAQIAARIGVSTRTVQRWLATPRLRDRKPRPPTGSQLDRYRDLIIQRWQEGCRSGAELYRELQQPGYGGSYRLVNHYLQQLFPPTAKEQRRRQLRQQTPQRPICTVHEATWLFLRDPTDLDEEEQATLKQVRAALVELDKLYEQVQQFRTVLHRREEGLFEAWVEQVKQEGSPEMRHFVKGLERDGEAVQAAMREDWSNGVTEGHIHRLKLVKRSMYGRAKLDLLRIRFLAA